MTALPSSSTTRRPATRVGRRGCGPRSGALIVAKPKGPTSHDIVERVRIAHDVKAGHSGTLDPFATGLLIVLVGRATKEQDLFLGMQKHYSARIRFGVSSTTGDSTGELTTDGRPVAEEEVDAALASFRGEIDQMVPAISAVKVGGRRLYEVARAGEQVERPIRRVTVERIELVDFSDQDATLAISCSKGTYVRQLAEDIGSALGSSAHCRSLERTGIGGIGLGEAAAIDDIERADSLMDLNAFRPMTVGFGDLEFPR